MQFFSRSYGYQSWLWKRKHGVRVLSRQLQHALNSHCWVASLHAIATTHHVSAATIPSLRVLCRTFRMTALLQIKKVHRLEHSYRRFAPRIHAYKQHSYGWSDSTMVRRQSCNRILLSSSLISPCLDIYFVLHLSYDILNSTWRLRR